MNEDQGDRIMGMLTDVMAIVVGIEPKINGELQGLEQRLIARIDVLDQKLEGFMAQTQDDFGEVRARLRRIETKLDLP